MTTDSGTARPPRRGAASIAWWLAAVALAALAVPVLARCFAIEWGPLVYVVALTPWVTLALVVPLAIAVAVRSWPLMGVAGVLTALCVAWMVPVYTGEAAGGEPVLRVMSLNLGYGNADADEVVALVRDRDIDLLALQEVTPQSVEALHRAGLDDALPHREVHAEQGYAGAGVWSGLPLSDGVRVDGFASNTVRARVSTDLGPLTVFTVHPEAPGLWGHRTWSQDYGQLVAILSRVNGPVLVAGDFNATRHHQAFRRLESLGYIVAADQAGAGFQPTFPQERLPFPVVAIDHVMVRDTDLHAVEAVTVAVAGADHRALVVTYAHP